ncbi:MAG: class I SAM-dependent methyltransferase [Hyphomicrobiales bacterium]|nr:class I SAM-dependent methyltransferase [Hyphomicrobiales bacterium]
MTVETTPSPKATDSIQADVEARAAPLTRITGCRSCGSTKLRLFLDLGELPLADRFLRVDQLNEHEPRFPLEVVFCDSCALPQILTTVDPNVLFRHDYPYYSSFIETVLNNARESAREIMSRIPLDPKSLVVEIASNDGYLLKNFLEQQIPVLGIDPAEGPVEDARRIGVESLCDFFGVELADRLVSAGRQADVIIGNNVLAHVADTNGFVAGIARLLKPEGMAVIEAPYVRDLIDHCEFDTIYHEHLCYFSATAFANLFERHGLYLNDVQRLSIHGGSLRYFASAKPKPSQAVVDILAEEKTLGLTAFDYYQDFSTRVENVREKLLQLLTDLRSQGKSIAGYGAAAKGTTLINYMDIGVDLVGSVADKNVHKQGCFMPGKRQPIFAPEHILSDMPDYLLLLAWNHAPEIMKQLSAYSKAGGQFIVPVPEPVVIKPQG